MIEKTKRKGSICILCNKPINSKYKYLYNGSFCHLNCVFEKFKNKLQNLKAELKQFNKTKYKRVMILESLEK